MKGVVDANEDYSLRPHKELQPWRGIFKSKIGA